MNFLFLWLSKFYKNRILFKNEICNDPLYKIGSSGSCHGLEGVEHGELSTWSRLFLRNGFHPAPSCSCRVLRNLEWKAPFIHPFILTLAVGDIVYMKRGITNILKEWSIFSIVNYSRLWFYCSEWHNFFRMLQRATNTVILPLHQLFLYYMHYCNDSPLSILA